MNANPYGKLRGPNRQLQQRQGVNPVINHQGLAAAHFSACHWRGAGWLVVGWVGVGAVCVLPGLFIGPKDFQGKGSGAVHYDLLAEELHIHTYTGIANTQMFRLVSSSSSIWVVPKNGTLKKCMLKKPFAMQSWKLPLMVPHQRKVNCLMYEHSEA